MRETYTKTHKCLLDATPLFRRQQRFKNYVGVVRANQHDTKVYFVGCGKEVGESDDVRVRHARFGHSRPEQLIRVPVLARVLSHHERGF